MVTSLKSIKNATKSGRFKPDAFLTHEPTTEIVKWIKKANAGPKEKSVLLFILVSPQMAMDILTLNTKNRPIGTERVLKYAGKMKAGKWLFGGRMILIDENNVVIDGQHELWAIIHSGTSQELHIHTQLDPKVYTITDDHRRRTAGDTLAYAGHENFNILATAIKTETYFRLHGRVGSNLNRQAMSNQEVDEWTEEHDINLMKNCLKFSINDLHKKFSNLTNSTWAMIYYTLSKRHIDQAKKFVLLLAEGGEELNTRKYGPLLACRKKLMKGFQEYDPKIHLDKKLKYIFTAWNYIRMKKTLPVEGLVIDDKAKILKPI